MESLLAAASMTWSQVTGLVMSSPAFSVSDFRNQSTWVLAQSGATTSRSSQVAPSIAPCSVPRVISRATSSGIGARKSAAANSAVNTGSRLISVMDESSATSRRSSWTRCSVALCGSSSVSTVYSSVLQRSAMPAWPNAPWKPSGGLGSGLMYQVSVGVPEPPPHAARTDRPIARAAASASARRHRRAPGNAGIPSPPSRRGTGSGGRPPSGTSWAFLHTTSHM